LAPLWCASSAIPADAAIALRFALARMGSGMNIRSFLGGRSPPKPSQGPGPGCAGLRPASAGDGETWFPHPPAPADHVHVSPHSRGAQDPMQTARECGRPALVASTRARCPRSRPMFTSAVHAAPPYTNRMNIGSSWKGCALPNPPAGGGMGKPGFSIPLLEGQALPRAGVWGNPVSPHPCSSSLCSR